ncbi:universal stress protein [Haloferacaceae archaeon DSL9]
MVSYRKILIPTDWSRAADRGVEHGLDLAADNDSEVHFVHIVDERYGSTPALSSFELALEDAESKATERLDTLVARARRDGLSTEIRCHCERGVPSEEIVAIADSVGADLIVMGKHGQGQSELPHIGKTSDRVLRTAKQPVFTV